MLSRTKPFSVPGLSVALVALVLPAAAGAQTAVPVSSVEEQERTVPHLATQGAKAGPGQRTSKTKGQAAGTPGKPGGNKAGVPKTRAIYDPAGGQKRRNLPRPDMPLCANWRGGPKGTLLAAGAGGGPLPPPGQHGLIALGYGEACDRGEALLKFSTRGESFFARGTIYTEDVGAYTAPDGTRVNNDRDRLSYNLGAGWIGQDGSFLSFGARRMDRDKILYQGIGPGVDTRKFDVEGYDIAGKVMLDGDAVSQVRFKARYNQFDRINDNFTYRTVSKPNTEVRLDRETVDVMAAIDGGGGGFKWTLGLDYASDQRDATKFQGAALAPFSANFADAEVSVSGLTADGTWALGAGGRLMAGLSLEHVDASLGDMDRSFAAPTPRQLFQQSYGYIGDGTATETNFGARLRLEQDLAGGQGQWFAGLSYTPRTADLRERYFASFSGNAQNVWIGNPDLAPERHAMVELGGGTRRGAWTLAGRAYADWVDDFILWDRARGQAGVVATDNRNIYRNVDAFIGGLEGSVTYKWDNGVHAGAEIWLTYGENTTDNRAIAQIPPAEAALTLGWTGKQVAFDGTWHLVAKQSRLDDDIFTGSGGDGDSYGGGLGAGYGTLDLAASWTPRKNTVFSVGVENVFDKDYVQLIERGDTDNPFLFNPTAPGRSLWAKATIRF